MRCTTGSVMTRREYGQQRCFYGLRIVEVLRRNGMSNRTIAYDLGITAQSVGATINGRNNSPRILDYLRNIGVPEQYLFDPRMASQNDNENFVVER